MSTGLGISMAAVILVSFLCSLVAGYVMHRADYCLAGMFRDLFLFRRLGLLRCLIVQVVATLVLLEIARIAGLWSGGPYVYTQSANLKAAAGGLVFGLGMVLCGSCVVGCLYKMAAGSALNLCAFLSMLAGAAFFAELAPWWGGLVKSWQLSSARTLPALLAWPTPGVLWPVAATGALWLGWSLRRKPLTVRAYARGFVQPWRAALILSVVTLVLCLVAGVPLGITSTYVKLGLWVEQWLAPEHVAQLRYANSVVLHYRPPLAPEAAGALASTLGPQFTDGLSLLQMPVIFGIVAGSGFSAWRLAEWRWQWRAPRWNYLLVVIGGVLTGLGARMASGCNVHFLLGELPLLTINALLFLGGLLPGSWLGSLILKRLHDRLG
ncbi:MAG: YeeE/YedE family protein [Desulfuromonadaceae bacterium]|nr:YeeE/YedE family protein [Desulfuromonadaceae bacterium]